VRGYISTVDSTHHPVEARTPQPTPYVHVAELSLAAAVDPAAVGAAVTVELCGHWQHEGACRWPHNNEVGGEEPILLRVLFLADEAEELEVRHRIEKALRSAPGWSVLSSGPRPVGPSERSLAARLSRVP
jgi:hypothetical protein